MNDYHTRLVSAATRTTFDFNDSIIEFGMLDPVLAAEFQAHV